jgi:hypothetical protein
LIYADPTPGQQENCLSLPILRRHEHRLQSIQKCVAEFIVSDKRVQSYVAYIVATQSIATRLVRAGTPERNAIGSHVC